MQESGLRKRSNNRNSAGEDLKRIAAFKPSAAAKSLSALNREKRRDICIYLQYENRKERENEVRRGAESARENER